MALKLKELKSIANATKKLYSEIKTLRNAGEDEKTDKIEAMALKLVDRLEATAINATNPGQGSSDELIQLLEAEKAALTAYIKQPGGLPFAERVSTRAHLQEIQFKLGAIKIGKTLTWDSLLSPTELAEYRDDLKAAALEVQRRRKLRSVLSSVSNIGIMVINLTTKIATLSV